MSQNRSTAEELNTRIEPIELTDHELKAVSGGCFTVNNSTIQNSVNNNTNSFNGEINVFWG